MILPLPTYVCFFRRRRRHAYEVAWRLRVGSKDWENPGLAGAKGMIFNKKVSNNCMWPSQCRSVYKTHT